MEIKRWGLIGYDAATNKYFLIAVEQNKDNKLKPSVNYQLCDPEPLPQSEIDSICSFNDLIKEGLAPSIYTLSTLYLVINLYTTDSMKSLSTPLKAAVKVSDLLQSS